MFKKWRENFRNEINKELSQIYDAHQRDRNKLAEWMEARTIDIQTHHRQIERGLKMCEESLEIIKKLLGERK